MAGATVASVEKVTATKASAEDAGSQMECSDDSADDEEDGEGSATVAAGQT